MNTAAEPPASPHLTLLCATGPFALEQELALLRDYEIDILVAKNSGGAASYPKLAAARELNIPVIMVRRPALPPGEVVGTVEEALDWLKRR